MKKVYYLSTCNTCKRIMKEVGVDNSFTIQDIKVEKITENQLEEMANLAGSYESLFSRTARKYREQNLKSQNLTENDYKHLILEEYTFLKRPVFIIDQQIFVGNSKKTVSALIEALK